MFGKTKADVFVIGAGPVGLFAALALAKKGVRVAIADKEWRTGAHSYALALHPQALALLDELGLKSEIMDKSHAVRTVGLYDGMEQRAEMQIGDHSTQPIVPLTVMRQDVLEHTLEEALRREGVKVLWNHSVSQLRLREQSVVLTLDKLEKDSVGYGVAHTEWMIAKTYDVEVPLVLAADGNRSTARRKLGIDFTEMGPPSHFAVFECELAEDLGQAMRLNLRSDTTDVLWPLPDRRCRWSFQLLDFAATRESRTKNRLPVEIGAARFPTLDEDHLQRFLEERAPWFTNRIKGVDWRIVVRFDQRLANSFGKGRVWLAGDAGHLTGPAGMQSMNVGLREAHDLANLYLQVLDGTSSAEQFAEYDRQRQAEWRQLLGLERGLGVSDATDPWIGEVAPRLMSCLPATGADLAALVAQIGLTLPA